MSIKTRLVAYGITGLVGLGAVLGLDALRSEPKPLPTFQEFVQQEIGRKKAEIAVADYLITDTRLRGLERELASVDVQLAILRTQQRVYQLQDCIDDATDQYQLARCLQ